MHNVCFALNFLIPMNMFYNAYCNILTENHNSFYINYLQYEFNG